MKVYLAAMYSWKPKIERYAEELRALGIEVTSTWLEEPHAPTTQLQDLGAENHRLYAQNDVQDINEADTFVLFSVEPTTPTLRGGRHVEFGMAIALAKTILVVGPPENIFHYLPRVNHVDTWPQAVNWLSSRV